MSTIINPDITTINNDTPVGAVMMWPTATPPTNWLILDGSSFSAVTYPALNTLLGGTTLPDMRQRFPIGKAAAGTGSTLLGTGGTIDHLHTQPTHVHTQPTHTHTGPDHAHTITHTHAVDPPNTTSSGPSGPNTIGISLLGLGAAASTTHTHTVDVASFTSGGSSAANSGNAGTGNTGASGGDNTGAAGNDNTGTANPPFLALNFIIKAA